eukprot:3297243-Rhodomonas_salina.1
MRVLLSSILSSIQIMQAALSITDGGGATRNEKTGAWEWSQHYVNESFRQRTTLRVALRRCARGGIARSLEYRQAEDDFDCHTIAGQARVRAAGALCRAARHRAQGWN